MQYVGENAEANNGINSGLRPSGGEPSQDLPADRHQNLHDLPLGQ